VFGNLTLNVSVDGVNVTGVVDFVYHLMSGKHDIAGTLLLSTTKKMQIYTIFFIIVNALHVSGGETARNM
jgi:hypothetical protein